MANSKCPSEMIYFDMKNGNIGSVALIPSEVASPPQRQEKKRRHDRRTSI